MTSTRCNEPGTLFSELENWMENQDNDNGTMDRLRRNLQFARTEELTSRQKELLTLYYDEGKSMRQIAREQGVAVSTVSRTIARAQNRLRRCLHYGF